MRINLVLLFAAACGQGVHSDPQELAPGEAACSTADGPLHDYSTSAELGQLIVGTWVNCSGPTLMGDDEQAIEFDPDGTYHVLVDDGQGGLAPATGFDGQGTWVGLQLTPTSVEFAWDNASHTGQEGDISFEDQPRKFSLALGQSSVYASIP
jgi:hypothetical protein